jgi:DNA topoisomerase I
MLLLRLTQQRWLRSKALIVVESPTKAKMLSQWLPDYEVASSDGHIRDLAPKSASHGDEIVAGISRKDDNTFEARYHVIRGKTATVKRLKSLASKCDALIVATDDDREGEAIGWHLCELLGFSPSQNSDSKQSKVKSKSVRSSSSKLEPECAKRIVFHEITEAAVRAALDGAESEDARLDMNLVRAQETRRVLDRLCGFTVSPLLWKKIGYGLSAGRVQSAALALIVARERERLQFRGARLHSVSVEFGTDDDSDGFSAVVRDVGDERRRLATTADIDGDTGLPADNALVVLGADDAHALRDALRADDARFEVADVQRRDVRRAPPSPFITSTLQQEAAGRLRMSVARVMQVAQALYESGLITYMRTDNAELSKEARAAALLHARQLGAGGGASGRRRKAAAPAKHSQRAHEAIRPTIVDGRFRSVAQLQAQSEQHARLYELIWRRTVASIMSPALLEQVTLDVAASRSSVAGIVAHLHASTQRIVEPSFMALYDRSESGADAASLLLRASAGDTLPARDAVAAEHRTMPPRRFSESSLIKRLEALGIGRPSTYASTIDTLVQRGYVESTRQRSLVPTYTGMAVSSLLERHVPTLVDVEFTERMENALDRIADSSAATSDDRFLASYYDELAQHVSDAHAAIDANDAKLIGPLADVLVGGDDDVCNGDDLPEALRDATVHVGAHGAYVRTTSGVTVTLPAGVAIDQLNGTLVAALHRLVVEPALIGRDPLTEAPIRQHYGPYGLFARRGDSENALLPTHMCALTDIVSLDSALLALAAAKAKREAKAGGAKRKYTKRKKATTTTTKKKKKH